MEIQGLDKEAVLDLARRWQESRISAIRESGGQDVMEESQLGSFLSGLSSEDYESLLKRVFLKSRNLGVSYQRHYKLVWELSDLRHQLGQMGSPCLSGNWEGKSEQASTLVRTGCQPGQVAGARFCQYWRESIDGLVMGLCESERYARHACITAGDSQCQDVFYIDDQTSMSRTVPNELRWGPLPEVKRKELATIQEKFQNMKVDLVFLGVSENKLYYRMESRDALSCGSAGNIMRTHLENLVSAVWQGVILHDASPLAVLGEQG